MSRFEFGNIGHIENYAIGSGATINTAPGPVAQVAGVGDLRSQLAHLSMEVGRVSEHQMALHGQAEELGAQAGQIAQARAALFTAASKLDTYAASI